MSRILKVQDSDYKIVVGGMAPGRITLDTSPNSAVGAAKGEVIITGDLTVLGTTTVIESTRLEVADNIIYINVGETGDGVSTLGTTAGLKIDRGNPTDGRGDVNVLFDENLTSRDPVLGSLVAGTFVFKDDSPILRFRPIATNSINTEGSNLSLIGKGTGIISVAGTVSSRPAVTRPDGTVAGDGYEGNILNYSLIDTEFDISVVSRNSLTSVATITLLQAHGLQTGQRVDINCATDSTFSRTFAPILSVPTPFSFTYSSPGNPTTNRPVTGIVKPNPIINDDAIPNVRAVSDLAYNALSSYSSNQISESDTKVQVSDVDVSGTSEIVFEVDGGERAVINNLGLTVDRIRIRGDNILNISNDNILFDNVLNIPHRVSVPSIPTGYVKIYSKNVPGTGDTGLFYVNTQGTNDELISKTRALLFSLIL